MKSSGYKTELLEDIRSAFEQNNSDRIYTHDLISKLCEDEEASWATYNKGKPIIPKQLAKLLQGFGIISGTIRTSNYDTAKGYKKEQFIEVWERYTNTSLSLPPNISSHTTQPSQILANSVTAVNTAPDTYGFPDTNVTEKTACYGTENPLDTRMPNHNKGCDGREENLSNMPQEQNTSLQNRQCNMVSGEL